MQRRLVLRMPRGSSNEDTQTEARSLIATLRENARMFHDRRLINDHPSEYVQFLTSH